MLYTIKKLIPRRLFLALQPTYHYAMALLAAVVYRFPSRDIFVIGITGTKGKTSVTELVNAILEEAGYTTAISSTVRFKVGETSENNRLKMTMPGRFFMQRFLRRAVRNNCDYAILEMTSEGAKQSRHKFIDLNTLIFTNLSPEHIESHGSYENYRAAKLSIAKGLETSGKERRMIIVNGDDAEAERFLAVDVPEKYEYHLTDAEPYTLDTDHSTLTIRTHPVSAHLAGAFNISNILAATTLGHHLGIDDEVMIRAIEKVHGIPGRMQRIDEGQDFTVIVDYAHTTDSLEKVYEVFGDSPKICVLGGTGGGRDRWKRKEMGAIAQQYCSQIILTDEDPYDEDPHQIIDDIKEGITAPIVTTIIDRREAMREAFKRATTGDTILITGKGTDPYIMGPAGSKLPWSDARVAQEELRTVLADNDN